MKEENKILVIVLLMILLVDAVILSSLFLLGNNLNDFGTHALDFKLHIDAGGFSEGSYHFPGYSWLIMGVDILSLNSLSWPVDAMIVSILFQCLTAIMIFKSIILLGLPQKRSGLITFLIMLFPIQIIFTTIHPRIDSTISFFAASAFYFYLKKEENKMILMLTLGALVHYVMIFFGIFLGLHYLKNKRITEIWKSVIVGIPFIFFSVYQYFVNHDLLHYISVHNEYVKGSLIVFPFYSLIQLFIKFTLIDFVKFTYLFIFLAFNVYCVWLLIKKKRWDILIFVLPWFLLAISLHGTDAYYDAPRFGLHHSFPLLIYPFAMMMDNWKNYKVKLLFFFFLTVSIVTLAYLILSFPLSNITQFYNLIIG